MVEKPGEKRRRRGRATGALLTEQNVRDLAVYFDGLRERLVKVADRMRDKGVAAVKVQTFAMAVGKVDYLVQMVYDAEKAVAVGMAEHIGVPNGTE